PLLSKISAYLASARVERVKLRLRGGSKDSRGANPIGCNRFSSGSGSYSSVGGGSFAGIRLTRGLSGCTPIDGIEVGDTTASIPEAVTFNLRIKHPTLLSGFCVQRKHLVARRADVQGITDLNRCVLLFRPLCGDFTGAEYPGHFQFADVVPINLIKWGIPRTG